MSTGERYQALIVDDDDKVRQTAAEVLAAEGLDVVTAANGEEAMERFAAVSPDVVVVDLRMPGMSGLDVLRRVKAKAPEVAVIVITGYGEIKTAVEAMKLGAYDFLAKPFVLEDFVATVTRALERAKLLGELESLRRRVGAATALTDLMGRSPIIAAVIEQTQQAARANVTVLLTGETGTGKELLARAIHQASPRGRHALVAVDCGAIPDTLIESELFGYEKGAFTGADRRKDGYFTQASGGTLFLDEIGNLPLTTQAKLLRALQERAIQPLGGTRPQPIDVRVIAATNAPLEREVQAGRFRQDLYYRLNEFPILVPALRDRRDDIETLAGRFLDEAILEFGAPPCAFAADALHALLTFEWPGNVRQLRNVVRRAALIAPGLIGPEHLSLTDGEEPANGHTAAAGPGEEVSLRTVVERAIVAAERQALTQALTAARGNQSIAARALRIDYKTLYRKMKHYGMKGGDFAG
jgi:two-component system nitrogen regulation response regulator GlnG